MKRSRSALALFLCSFVLPLLGVGFADGESHPLSHASGLQPADLDQLDFGLSPSCFLGVPRGVAGCESSIDVTAPSACPVSGEVLAATDCISRIWADFSPAAVTETLARQIGEWSAFAVDRLGAMDAQSWDAGDEQLEAICADWIAREEAIAAQAASDSHFLYALSGAWRASYQDSLDAMDGCYTLERYLRDEDCRATARAADSQNRSDEDEATLLNRLSDGLTTGKLTSELTDEEGFLQFVAKNFGSAYAVAISRHREVPVRHFESLWSGCDALPNASTEGWIDDAARAESLEAWRAIVSPIADLAGLAARGSHSLTTIVSQQIAGWVAEHGANVASDTPSTPPAKPDAPRNATRSTEAFITL